MTATPADVAAMLRGIRHHHQAISASAVETLLHIATGADCSAELCRRMGVVRQTANRNVAHLIGRGRIGKGRARSRLGLVQRSKHPDRPGFRLELTPDGRELIASTFGLAER
jgi:DNA-binding MarR family transcriptional regulator